LRIARGDKLNKHDIIKLMLKKDVSYKIKDKSISFLPGENKPSNTAGISLIGNIQDRLKRYGWLYYGLIQIFKPVWRSRSLTALLQDLLLRYGTESVVLNLGSGPRVYKKRLDIINVDLFGFKEIDMIADASDLPIEDNVVDLVLNQAMLEHVKNPDVVVSEMHRILRPGGEALCYLPFISPFHAAPYDFNRWTVEGVRELFQAFDQTEIGIGGGPTSGMLWVFQEWLSLLLSFGSRRLHDIIFIILMSVTAPIKLIDIFLINHPYANRIASGFYILAKKKDVPFTLSGPTKIEKVKI